jgi:hypothetical protein
MEHAAVAAFARFTLQLLALGAPPELIEGAQAAIADETEHTKICFTLASAYAGRPLGPGPLALDGALGACSAQEILVTTILEGCVGETLAALEAAEVAPRAEDPALRRALAKISDDETRHAELAWRFVQWALRRDPSLAEAAREAFAAALGEGGSGGTETPDRSAHGLAGAALKREIARRTRREVIRPCAEALLSAARPMVRERAAIAAA